MPQILGYPPMAQAPRRFRGEVKKGVTHTGHQQSSETQLHEHLRRGSTTSVLHPKIPGTGCD